MNAEITQPVLPLPPYTQRTNSDVMWCHMMLVLYRQTHRQTDRQSTLQCTTATWALSESSHDFIDLQILWWYAYSDNNSIATGQLTLTTSPVKALSDPANQNPVPVKAISIKTLIQNIRITQDVSYWQSQFLFNIHTCSAIWYCITRNFQGPKFSMITSFQRYKLFHQ